MVTVANRRSTNVASIVYSDSKTLLIPAPGFMENYDFTLNPYSECGFGCGYCYARFFAPTEEARDTWGQWVKVKENAVEAIRKARASHGKNRLEHGAKIYMSSVTAVQGTGVLAFPRHPEFYFVARHPP